MDEKTKKFLDGLQKLSEETGVQIIDCSCGCCGHTYLADSQGKELIGVVCLPAEYTAIK